MKKVLFLHGRESKPGGSKAKYLEGLGYEVFNPLLPQDSYEESLSIAQRLIDKEKSATQSTILEEVRKTMQELPSVQREALEIAFNGKSRKLRDVCREKGNPYSTVRSRITAGIDRIQRRLKAKGVDRTFEAVR